jgi:hypothetical protein
MKDSDDIANLLKQFGGRPEEYYEIGRASDARDSQARWPLLSSIEATQGEHHPPVQPHTPGATPAAGIGGLRARPGVQPETQPETRVEPRFAATPDVAGRLVGPAAAPAVTPAAATAAAAPGARAAPQAQFVPPRPRGHIVPPTRPAAPLAGNLAGMRPAAPDARPTEAAAAPTQHLAFTRPAPQRTDAAPAPAIAPAQQGTSTPLQDIFSRLSHPKPAPERSATLDKNASLLQRLSRL